MCWIGRWVAISGNASLGGLSGAPPSAEPMVPSVTRTRDSPPQRVALVRSFHRLIYLTSVGDMRANSRPESSVLPKTASDKNSEAKNAVNVALNIQGQASSLLNLNAS